MDIIRAIIEQAVVGGSELKASELTFLGTYDISGGAFPSSPSKGDYYVISKAGIIAEIEYNVNEFIWFNGSIWTKTPAMTTGVTLVNGQTGNVSIDTDNLPVGDNKFLIQEQVDKVDNLPVNTIEELDSKFKKEWNSDKLVEGNNHLFMSVLEKNKLNNLPLNVNDEIDKKFNKTSSTDKLVEGTINLFITQEDKNKLNNLPLNVNDELNKKIDNTITADNIPDGVNKFFLGVDDKAKLDGIPDDIEDVLDNVFDKVKDDTDDITEGITSKFMSVLEKQKLNLVPNDTTTELSKKYDLFANTMDDVRDGTAYVKTSNDFTTDLKNKLYNLADNYKGYFSTSTDLITAFPVGSAGLYATVEDTGSIWIWNDNLQVWQDSTSAGTGDMLRVTYDPSNKARDIYNMDNMEEGLLNAIISKADKYKLQDIDINLDKQTVTNDEKLSIAEIGDKITLGDLDDFLTIATTTTNTVELQYNKNDVELTADVLYQNSDTTTISDTVDGLKVDVKANTSIQKVEVALDGTVVSDKKTLNFVTNAKSTFTITEDNINDRINIELETQGTSSDGKIKVSDEDIVSNYLVDKLVGTTDKISLTIDNVADNEQLIVNIGADIFDKEVNTADDITEGTTNLFLTRSERSTIDALSGGLDFNEIFNKQVDTLDNILDGTDYVKVSVTDKAKLDEILKITTENIENDTKVLDTFSMGITGVKYFYTVKSGTKTRIGELMVVHNGTDVSFTDNVVDIGTRDDIKFTAVINNDNIVLSVVGVGDNWELKFTKIEL